MAFFSNYRERQVLPDVIEALQRFEEDPEQLTLERAQRYSDPPPPYPSSGETTQLNSPVEASAVDESALQAQRNLAIFRSTPYERFSSQRRRERERIIYQLESKRYARRQTIPVDDTLDLVANAENSIRARWVQQGIWQAEWGPAWSKGAQPSDNRWLYSRKNTGGPCPSGRWGHEKEPEPKPILEPKRNLNIFAGVGRAERIITKEVLDVTAEPTATSERDTSASRPYHQFLFQVSQEREWIRDELQYNPPTGTIDVDAMAYENTRNSWIEDQIWNHRWGELPGMTWMHEELDEELHQTLPDAVSGNEQRPRLPNAESFNPEPAPGIENDSSNSNNSSSVPEVNISKAAVAKAGGRRKRTNKSADQVLRGVRLSKVESRVLRSKGRPKDERQTNRHRKNTLDTEQHIHSVDSRLPVASGAPRRSARIAARMQNMETGLRRGSGTNTAVERRTSTRVSKGRSRSTPRATFIADGYRIGKRQSLSKGRAKARRQSKP